MPQWVREPDRYECNLPRETQLVALKELRETKHTRDEALELMRDWVKKNPRIANCRLDARFLLRFLRTKKFSVLQAEEALERYLLLRQTYAPAFRTLDYTDHTMNELISNGYLFPVPQRDHLGRRLIIGIASAFDPYKYTNADMLRVHGITYETLMEDEMNQVHGYVHFADGAGVGFHYLTIFTPKEAVRIAKNGERTLPMRHKEGHGINAHPSLKFAIDFGFSLIPEKYKKRIKVHTCIEDALKYLDPKIMPKEYGGVMPMAEMIALWKQELQAARGILLSHDQMEVRLDMYSAKAREGAVSALKEGFTCKKGNDIMGVTGSFRKLEVD
ncbi:hypothetical protein Cfor_01382 [Coptotermes formosanus]|uniref:CRAL-TRIO domain-containing protein n=1 Tax=Coptotermes formosanus TaxID=36987 RepID=A0A6L2PUH0_COPFO|nr:hypothetical protein Cfor_01382 [Coptotermes formosanus]